MVSAEPVSEWTDRIRAEYLEMPGLALTTGQMCRLWRIDASVCDAVIEALVATAFLRRRGNDVYVRRDGGA